MPGYHQDMKNSKRNYSEAQTRYTAAAAAFAVVEKQDTLKDEEYCAAFKVKVDAERALYAWCRETVATDPKTARQFAVNAADLDNLFSSAWKFPSIRAKLTDACLRLAV